MENESNLNFPLNIRIELINGGQVTITHETIIVKSKNSNFGTQNKNFIRIFNKEELDSIELATSLTSTEESFRKCYESAKDLFKIMKLLYYYGNPYHTFTLSKFSGLCNNNNNYFDNYSSLLDFVRDKINYFNLNSDIEFDIKGSQYPLPILPRFLTVENILFLSKLKNSKEHLRKIGYDIDSQGEDPQLRTYPYLSMIKLLTSIKKFNNSQQGVLDIEYKGENRKIVEEKFNSIKKFYDMNSIHFIKVDKPVHCFHLLYPSTICFLQNQPILSQILYCHKNTDIRNFLNEFTNLNQTSFKKCIIFHPEFLDESNFNILLEESKARISAVSIQDDKKILIISSLDFTQQKEFVTHFDNKDISCCRLTSNKRLVQPDIKKAQLVSSSSCQNNSKEEVYFIDKETQHAEFLEDKETRLTDYTKDKIYRFKFAPEMFDDSIDFWDEMFSSIFFGYYISNDEIIINSFQNFPAIFEEPFEGLINDLNDFPFPINIDNRGIEIIPFPTFSEKAPDDKNTPSVKNFLSCIIFNNYGITANDSMIDIIKKLYKTLFNEDFDRKISNHLLRYISDYILYFSTNYLSCLWEKDIRARRIKVLFLIGSALCVYNLNPKDQFYIMGFSGMLDNRETRSIDFYTTKKKSDLIQHAINLDPNTNFNLYFEVIVKRKIDNCEFYKRLAKCITSDPTFEKKITDIFQQKDSNKILNYSLSWPKFFKSIMVISRLSLSQPTILSGDTGCGKTSFIHMLQYLISKSGIYDCKIKFSRDLNIHGDVNRKEIEDHLIKSAKKNPEYNTFFFDEFNTSDALPFIEHIFLNGYSGYKFVFIGAINPLVKADSISKVLSKIGMEQNIYTESSSVSLLNLTKTEENLNDYKYFVHKLNESEDLIIDFNPTKIDEKESEYLPNEEKALIESVINIKSITLYIDESFIPLLFNCIEWIRKFMRENAVVSVRDVNSVIDFYIKYNEEIKNDKNDVELYKQSFYLSIISVFALRLPMKLEIPSDNTDILDHVKALEMDISEDNKIVFVRNSFLKIVGDPNELMKLFDKFTFWFLRSSIMQDKNIWKFKSFLYHVVVMKMVIKMTKACFVIGPPGTSKSFALEQIAKDRNIFVTTYMCSRGSSSEGLKAQFYDAVYIGKSKKVNMSVISFEEMGLANINKRRPLKYIHFALDLGIEINDQHQFEKVASIGVSNYAMDLANMNRGTLIYTDIPSIEELKMNFANDIVLKKCDKVKFNDFNDHLEIKEEKGSKVNWIEGFFQSLWPNNSQPKTLALRSIYSLYRITKEMKDEFEKNGQKISTNFFCKVAREIVNARRLIKINNNKINDDFKDLAIPAFDFILRMFPDVIYNIPDELLEKPEGEINIKKYEFEIDAKERTIKCTFQDGDIKYFNIKVDNLFVLLDRVISKDSFKSLCLLTRDYSALDNIRSILIDNLPATTQDLQFILNSEDGAQEEVVNKIKNMPKQNCPDVSYYFEEDFKSTDSSSESQKSVNNFIQSYMRNPNEIPVIVGNNPMLDSLLDILNANKINSDENKTFNALISSDGFSWSYDIRTDFYLVLILQLEELVSKMGAIPLPLLDRLEIVYIDWSQLKYLVYFKLIQNSDRFATEFIHSGLSYKKFVDRIDDSVCQYLNTQTLPDFRCPHRFDADNVDRYLHSSLPKLFDNFYKSKAESDLQLITNNDLHEYLMSTNWKESIRCVIYTKSMLGDDVNYRNIFNEFEKEDEKFKFIWIDDETIADEDQFNKKIENCDKKRFLVIKCSKYSEMHDQHLKKLIEKKKFEGSVFIIYYYTGKEKVKSTMNWPVFWFEDISVNFLVMKSENSADLKSIYGNLGNREFNFKNKQIMAHLIIERLFKYFTFSDDNNASDSKYIRNRFKEMIHYYYQDDCSNLIDHFDAFEENPESPYSIQTQIFNHLMKQLKHKLLYFLNVLFCHFLSNKNSPHFVPKQVYDFLRINYKELPNEIVDMARYDNYSSDFRCILKNDVKNFLNNSPHLYFPNTFGYRFLEVVKNNSSFVKFIELFKKQRYRDRYYRGLNLEDDSELQAIIRHLNRDGFLINKKHATKIVQLVKRNRQFYGCSEQLLMSKGVRIKDAIDSNEWNSILNSYNQYADGLNFNIDINSLIWNLNSNKKDEIVSNSFERIFIYFNYILNFNIIELTPNNFYTDIEKYIQFNFSDLKNLRNIFWQCYILSYIFYKKKNDKTDLLKYKELISDINYSFFDNLEENLAPGIDQSLQILSIQLYSKLFFTAPQISYLNTNIDSQFKKLMTNFLNSIGNVNIDQIKSVDIPIFESLYLSSCILDEKQIPEKLNAELFDKFTTDFGNLDYFKGMVHRLQGVDINKGKNGTEIIEYKWETVKGQIMSSNLVKSLYENKELDNIIDAPSFKGHSLLELLHFYMTDAPCFSRMMEDTSDQFILWFFQDIEERDTPLFVFQIYLLFRAVISKNEELIKNQLIALLSFSAPWKAINDENFNEFVDSKFNFFAFRAIQLILELPPNHKRVDIMKSLSGLQNLVALLRSTTEGNGGYNFVNGKDLYVVGETLPTISTVIFNHFVFNNQYEFPLFKKFVKLQNHSHFLNTASKIMKIVFKLRKIFAKNSRALFVILNCFSFVKSEKYDLIQDLPFISPKFDKLFNIQIGHNRNIFTLDDFNRASNAYEQIDFISKKYFRIHNEFVSFQEEKIVLPLYHFMPKMSIAVFDFTKFLAQNVLKQFVKLHAYHRQFLRPQDINSMLENALENNCFPFVTFGLDDRFKFDKQPILNGHQKVDFLGMCKEDWVTVLSLLINEPDSTFVADLRKMSEPDGGCDMTKIASLLLQIYYREQSEEGLIEICPNLDFGDDITINMGFEVPESILRAPIFEYLPENLKIIIRNIFE